MFSKFSRGSESWMAVFVPYIAFLLFASVAEGVCAEASAGPTPILTNKSSKLSAPSVAVTNRKAPSELDMSFGNGGIWSRRLNPESVIPRDLLVTRQGRVVYVAGLYNDSSSANTFWFTALTPAGVVDSTYGAGGYAQFTPPGTNSYFDEWYGNEKGAFLFSSNRITDLPGGPGAVIPMMGRLTEFGLPQGDFGVSGWRNPVPMENAFAWQAMLPLSDGSVLAYFQTTDSCYTVARFDDGGELMALNAESSQICLDPNLGLISTSKFVQASNGYIYLITPGALTADSAYGIRVRRLQPDLRLDSEYGSQFFEWPVPTGHKWSLGLSLHPLADGSVLLAGATYVGSDMDRTYFSAIRLDRHGRPDTDYGVNGAVSYFPTASSPFNPDRPFNYVGVPAVAPDGSLFAVMTLDFMPVISAFDAAGELKTDFGVDGEQSYTFCVDDTCYGQYAGKAVIAPTGQILVSASGGFSPELTDEPLVFALQGFDGSPEALEFAAGSASVANTWVASEPVQPKGYDGATKVWIDNGEFAVSEQPNCSSTAVIYSSLPSGISPGQWLCVRVRSPELVGERNEASIQVGATVGKFAVTLVADTDTGGTGGTGGGGTVEMMLLMLILLSGLSRIRK